MSVSRANARQPAPWTFKLKSLQLNVRHMDLRIAAIAHDHDAMLVTRNLKDFRDVPSLAVENWSD